VLTNKPITNKPVTTYAMQNLEEVKVLLDKYWSGETTLDEERALKKYFAGPAVAEQFRPMIPLFQTLRQEKDLRLERSHIVPRPVRSSLRSRWAVAAAIVALLAVGGWWMFGPQPAENMVVQTPTRPVQAVPTPAPAPPVATPTPAPVITEQLVTITKPIMKRKKVAKQPIDPEAEMAMEEIKAALALVSSKLNKGKKAAMKDLNRLEDLDKFIKPKVG